MRARSSIAATVLALALAGCGGGGGDGLSDDEAPEAVDDLLDALADGDDFAEADDESDTADLLADWLDCAAAEAGDPEELADGDVTLEGGEGDVVETAAVVVVAYDGGGRDVVDALGTDEALDCLEDEVLDALEDAVGDSDGADPEVDLDAAGDVVVRLQVDGEVFDTDFDFELQARSGMGLVVAVSDTDSDFGEDVFTAVEERILER